MPCPAAMVLVKSKNMERLWRRNSVAMPGVARRQALAKKSVAHGTARNPLGEEKCCGTARNWVRVYCPRCSFDSSAIVEIAHHRLEGLEGMEGNCTGTG